MFVALAALTAISPLILLPGAATSASGQRPILRQMRIGRNALPFETPEFRTVRDDAARLGHRAAGPRRRAAFLRLARWLRDSGLTNCRGFST
jgi:lipopolysaccharide/colanic/teichoic acid biosynthesis glycosyltransferase